MKSVESVKKVVKKANTLKNAMKYQPSSGSKVGSSSSSKAVLNNKNLAKGDLVGPPPLTLQEHINKAIEGGDSEENALFKLKDNLSKLDKSNIWSQYQTFLKTQQGREGQI